MGYEIPFNRHFYEYEPPRALEEIEADIKALEQDIFGHACRGYGVTTTAHPQNVQVFFENIREGWSVERLYDVADIRTSNVDKKSEEGEEAVLLCNYVDVYKNELIDQNSRVHGRRQQRGVR